MSGIAAYLCWPPQAFQAGLIERMVERGGQFGPDGVAAWSGPPAALGYCHARTTPEEEAVAGLIQEGDLWLAPNLRLDNRDELLAELRQAGQVVAGDASDGRLCLAAYRAWGTDAFARLVGEVALALWDGGRRTLLCVRDAIGLRPLFYHVNRERFLAGSAIRQLWADAGTPDRLCPTAVGRFLAAWPADEAATFYTGVRRLPPGCWLAADVQGRVRCRRFWHPERVPLAAGRSPAEQAAEFRRRFLDAVRAQLRSPARRVAVHVSGGLDSSAVAAAVHHLNGTRGLGLEPWAFINVGRHPQAEEQRYRDELLARYPMPVEATSSDDFWAFQPVEGWHACQDEPGEGNYLARGVHELRRARALGIRVLLAGAGGDELAGSSWYLVDRLLRGQPGGWLGELRCRSAARDRRSLALLAALLVRLAAWLRNGTLGRRWPVPAWLDPGLARQLPAIDRRRPISWNPARDDQFVRLRTLWTGPYLEMWQAVYSQLGVETRLPYYDRRIIEWALSVPPAQLSDRGLDRALVRQGLADLLPPGIAGRASKGVYLAYVHLGLRQRERPRIEQLLDRPVAEAMGFVRGVPLRQAYRAYCRGGPLPWPQLWNFLTFEAWLRGRQPPGSPAPAR